MGGGLNSSSVYRPYPDGPPSCTQCSPNQLPTAAGGFIGLPTNESCLAYFGSGGCVPLVPNWGSAAFLVLYVVWTVTALLALFWAYYRTRWLHASTTKRTRRIHGKRESTASKEEDDPTYTDEESQSLLPGVDLKDEADEEKSGRGSARMTVEYLKHSKAETVASIAVVSNGLLLLAYYLLLTFDFYIDCQSVPGSVDNSCFFGTFKVFGNYENNAEAFFLVWWVMFFYLIFLAFFWRDLFDWVSLPTSEDRATKVRVWLEDEVHILTSGKLSWGQRFKRTTEDRLRRSRKSFVRMMWGDTAAYQSGRSGRYSTVPILTTELGTRYFIFESIRYSVPTASRAKLTLDDPTIGAIRGLRVSNGPDPRFRKEVRDRCGPNAIPLTLPSYRALLLEEFMTPFYAYQLQIYLIWIWWTYWFVGLWLLLIVIFAGLWSVILKRKSLREVHALAEHHDTVQVMKDQRDWSYLSDASDLVCGDVVKVSIEAGKTEWVVPADLVLTDGSCAVDESGLTGESMPRSKTAISGTQSDASLVVTSTDVRFKSHILYAGTKVLEASPDAAAVVLAVGSDATRGQLLAHVLYPVKTLFRFDEEFSVAVFLLLIYAMVAFIIAISFQVMNGSASTWPTILAYGVMTVSQIVSPMLKIALVAGRVAAVNRLKKKGIACLDPHRIDIAGKVRIFCFDKTGTLTMDGLTFLGFRPCLTSSSKDESTLGDIQPQFLSSKSEACKAAATCHALGFYDGRFLGSSVESAMFKSTGWSLTSGVPDEACSPDATVRTIVKRRLAFDQERRIMSVVVEETQTQEAKSKTAPVVLYVKGAPESVARRCTSGLPANFLEQANKFAAEGCYVLALAFRVIPSSVNWSDAARDDLETNLACLGLLIFRNELKRDATYAIQQLKAGHIRCVMITGDNAPCGCFVAKEAGLVDPSMKLLLGHVPEGSTTVQWKTMFETEQEVWDSTNSLMQEFSEGRMELALTGDAFDKLRFSGELFDKRILLALRIFARMSPAQKVQVVHAFMDGPEGVVCAMAGDGGNDSGALRAAHVGLSMSSAEASVVAPFNSANDSVFSCVELIIEGRAALATSLASYKLLVIYGMLFSIVKMCSFYYAVLMPLLGYVMIDIIAVVPLTFAMTLSKPLKHLGPKRPTSSLLGFQTVSSVVGFIVISISSISINLAVMSGDAGYVKWPAANADTAAWWFISDNWESTVIFVSCFLLFISSAPSFSFGSGFRSSVFSNYWLVLLWLVLFIFISLVFLLPLNSLSVQFHMASEQFNRAPSQNPVWIQYQASGGATSPAMSFDLRLLIWLLSVIAIGCVWFWERFVVFGPGGRAIQKAYEMRYGPLEEADFKSF